MLRSLVGSEMCIRDRSRFMQQASKGIIICNIQFTIGVLIHRTQSEFSNTEYSVLSWWSHEEVEPTTLSDSCVIFTVFVYSTFISSVIPDWVGFLKTKLLGLIGADFIQSATKQRSQNTDGNSSHCRQSTRDLYFC